MAEKMLKINIGKISYWCGSQAQGYRKGYGAYQNAQNS